MKIACYSPPEIKYPHTALEYIWVEFEQANFANLNIGIGFMRELLLGEIFACCQRAYFDHLPFLTAGHIADYRHPAEILTVFTFYFRNWDFRFDDDYNSFVPFVRSRAAAIVSTTKVAERMFFEDEIYATGTIFLGIPDGLPKVIFPAPRLCSNVGGKESCINRRAPLCDMTNQKDGCEATGKKTDLI